MPRTILQHLRPNILTYSDRTNLIKRERRRPIYQLTTAATRTSSTEDGKPSRRPTRAARGTSSLSSKEPIHQQQLIPSLLLPIHGLILQTLLLLTSQVSAVDTQSLQPCFHHHHYHHHFICSNNVKTNTLETVQWYSL